MVCSVFRVYEIGSNLGTEMGAACGSAGPAHPACGSVAALTQPARPARYRVPGQRDRLVYPRSRATVPRIGYIFAN